MLADRFAAVPCVAGVIVGGVQGSLHWKGINWLQFQRAGQDGFQKTVRMSIFDFMEDVAF